MALQSLPLKTIQAFSAKDRTYYFEHFARYFKDSPDKCYAIRVGSKTLHSSDTMELRKMFDAELAKEQGR